MHKQLFDADALDHVFYCGCGEKLEDESDRRNDTECIACFENADCPDQCNEEHDGPEPDCDGQWRCPTTENVYTLNDGDWALQSGRYPETSQQMPDGEWYTYPNDFDWAYCPSCDNWRGMDSITYDRWGESRGCEYCDDGDDEYSEMPCIDTVRCDHCGTRGVTITHWNPLTEAVSCCDCHVGELVPVLVAA